MSAVKKRAIAYLEDDLQQSERVTGWLSEHGYDFQTFTHANAILAAFEAQPFDAAILDWELDTGSSGLDVLTSLRHDHGFKRPILMLTAKNNPADAQQALSAGATDFLRKPVNRVDLLAAIDRFCRPHSRSEVIEYGSFVDDTIKQHIIAYGAVLDLTRAEYTLASLLFREQGRWIPIDRLQTLIEDELPLPGFRGVDLFILRLKKKMQLARSDKWRLEMVYGHGYRVVQMDDLRRAG